ncbi:MAG: hypothetical protein DSM106950_44820 [Stigonema ocellatum SAG 48.90 = DSM 106950]|nr:hypothetical protein [Stigonema ocellatum SAG 48.90 = DSM 106950]
MQINPDEINETDDEFKEWLDEEIKRINLNDVSGEDFYYENLEEEHLDELKEIFDRSKRGGGHGAKEMLEHLDSIEYEVKMVLYDAHNLDEDEVLINDVISRSIDSDRD